MQLMHPFAKYTTALSKSHGPTIHNIFHTYEVIFNHLDKQDTRLQHSCDPWKSVLQAALAWAWDKMEKYYSATVEIHGYYYAIGTILSLWFKVAFFTTTSWAENNFKWK